MFAWRGLVNTSREGLAPHPVLLARAYGKVVDVYLPIRKSKAGKRFERPPVKSNTQPIVMRRSSPIGSYISALKTGKTESFCTHNTNPAIVLDESYILENECKLSVMGKVKEFESISNLYFILANEGFENLSLSYLGGMWVLIDFSSDVTKQKFLKHVGVGSWFSSLDHVNPKFISEERIVWVDIEGIPLHGRSKNTFNKIGLKWRELSCDA
ncbi:hypothetical protein Tco_1445898 [Tanacetum coccineum]